LVQCCYSTLRRWMRRGAFALGLNEETFSSHSCRRGGATSMALGGAYLASIMLAGRWQSESSCRLYIRRGEVALLRIRQGMTVLQWERVCDIARLAPVALHMRDLAV
jgi:hypothetical protein